MEASSMDAIAGFAAHVAATQFRDLPGAAIAASKVFILDTLGVGIAGSSSSWAQTLAQMQQRWGSGEAARVWGSGRRLPAPAAAMCNAYQVHGQEFDCLHEQAVVHAMSVLLPVALAGVELSGGVGGEDLITAVVLGVDVAAGLGVAAASPLRFFRPATAGAFGATAALGKLIGLGQCAMLNAFSITYGQLCGTMQAHAEGSDLLAMQMAFNARNAFTACDLAAKGYEAPKNVLEGPFGYFALFETSGSPGSVVKELGRRWFITELAHKPFPCGRATHGIIEGCLELRTRHRIAPDSIDRVIVRVPPLVRQLVGRPPQPQMRDNYARLCAPYVAACALLRGRVGREDFTAQAYRDLATGALAQRVVVQIRDHGDPNALTPVAVEIDLRNGARHTCELDTVYGNPRKPLSHSDHLAKFFGNCQAAARPPTRSAAEALVASVDGLEAIPNVGELLDLTSA
jgi:2-methylcitrate dehydratase PrpD